MTVIFKLRLLDVMMKSLQIKNFKNLRRLSLSSLDHVNLIVGRNNTGKSSLLEAISLLATKGDISRLYKILNQRGEMVLRREMSAQDVFQAALSLYSDYDYESFIEQAIEMSDGENVKIELKLSLRDFQQPMLNMIDEDEGACFYEEDNDEEGAALYFNDRICYANALVSYGNGKNIGHIPFTSNHRSLFYSSFRGGACEYVGLNRAAQDDLAALYDKIAMSDLYGELIGALNIIEPRVCDINFLTQGNHRNTRFAYVRYKGTDDKLKLSSMGDGINRILSIALAMLNCRDGVFLIDEFDNGLHYSVQDKLWGVIYHLSQRLNIQVFATTHSDDCVRSFAANAKSKGGKLIRLECRDKGIVSVDYQTPAELEYISNNPIEVR